MFLRKDNELPVNEFDQNLIDQSLLWFENKLGSSYIRSVKYLIPSQSNFKYDKFDSDESIEYFIAYICEHISLDVSIIEYKILDDDLISSQEAVQTMQYDNEKRMLFQKIQDGKYMVALYSTDLKNANNAFLHLAYVLVYIKLFEEGVFTFANGYMINMAMVIMGFGIWGANSVIQSQQWKGLVYHGWSVQRFGFITQRMYGYLLALLAQYRSQENGDWQNHLCPDVYKSFKQSESYIVDCRDEISFLTKRIPVVVQDEEVFIHKYFYKNGKISWIARYANGKYEGIVLFYHENGILWSERIYKNGIPYTILSNYDSDGDSVEKGSLKEGNGTLYIYNADRSLLKIEEYRDGIRIDNISSS